MSDPKLDGYKTANIETEMEVKNTPSKRTDTEILNALQDLPWRIDILYKQGQPKSDSVPHIRDQINDFLDRESKNKDWIIEYEIPPLRAIYTAEASSFSEAELREDIRVQQPLWRIRKIKLKSL